MILSVMAGLLLGIDWQADENRRQLDRLAAYFRAVPTSPGDG